MESHRELAEALQRYRTALADLVAAAHRAADTGMRDTWPARALRAWWSVAGLGPEGARRALHAWRSYEGHTRAEADRVLRAHGDLPGGTRGAWGRWERGEETPDEGERQAIADLIGIPPSAWEG